jgi:outer membrane protease
MVLCGSAFATDSNLPETTTENVAITTISVGTEILDGDTTYKIGYPVTMDGVTTEGYFPFSELKWPLDVVMGRVDMTATFPKGWRIKGYVKKNLSEPNDDMEDSDWLTESNPKQLDVYSESYISDFSAFIADLDMEYIFYKNRVISFFGGAGYQYQKFEYDANLRYQYSPSGLSGYDYTGDGTVGISYEISYYVPYLIVGTDIQIADSFKLSSSFAFSPYVKAKDEDQHRLREYGGKVTNSDMDGIGYIFIISGKYNFTPKWYAELGFQATRFDVDGTMDQAYVWYGYFGSNKVEADTTQVGGYCNVGFTF